jgi:two-component system, OmpR family, sensor histidine kinase KdpD
MIGFENDGEIHCAIAHMTQSEAASSEIGKLRNRGWRFLLRAVPGIIVAGLVTFICYGLGLSSSVTAFCYLTVVVLQSLAGDFRSSAVVSVLCAAGLDYFFIPPLFSFRVSDSSDTLALITFLVTGLIVTRLVSQTREAAGSEELQRKEMTRLYELALQLLALEPGTAVGPKLLMPFRSKFDLRAVCLFDAETAGLYVEGNSRDDIAGKTRNAYIGRRNFEDPGSGLAVRLIQAGGRTSGAIGFEGLRDCQLTAGPLAALATIMLEQSLAFQRASHAAAMAETEMFRGVVLDALAHEFKTPLTTILAAAGGLHEAGPLRPEQRQLAAAVESEASRLEQLTTRLVRLARLDRAEVRPQMELIDVADILKALVDQYSRRWPGRRLSLNGITGLTTLGDPELLRFGLGQLLDNACKYSRPDSDVRVSIESPGELIAVDVWNDGTPIPSNERARIFDRFYRGAEAQKQASGSGLGLYVARKIALAHGGNLELDGPAGANGGTAFRFTIPLSNSEFDHDP